MGATRRKAFNEIIRNNKCDNDEFWLEVFVNIIFKKNGTQLKYWMK